jgi:hypothetical protein
MKLITEDYFAQHMNITMEKHILDTNAGKQLPQISNQLWCLKNEQHLNMD